MVRSTISKLIESLDSIKFASSMLDLNVELRLVFVKIDGTRVVAIWFESVESIKLSISVGQKINVIYFRIFQGDQYWPTFSEFKGRDDKEV